MAIGSGAAHPQSSYGRTCARSPARYAPIGTCQRRVCGKIGTTEIRCSTGLIEEPTNSHERAFLHSRLQDVRVRGLVHIVRALHHRDHLDTQFAGPSFGAESIRGAKQHHTGPILMGADTCNSTYNHIWACVADLRHPGVRSSRSAQATSVPEMPDGGVKNRGSNVQPQAGSRHGLANCCLPFLRVRLAHSAVVTPACKLHSRSSSVGSAT